MPLAYVLTHSNSAPDDFIVGVGVNKEQATFSHPTIVGVRIADVLLAGSRREHRFIPPPISPD
jgi:hypothetical protein